MNFEGLETLLDSNGIVFLSYGGLLSQALISGMTEALEKEAESNEISMRVSTNIFTIFIELSQNLMNYSKAKCEEDSNFDPKGLLIVGYEPDVSSYYILSRNIVSDIDKAKMESRLGELEGLDKEGLKQLYKELRRSGRGKHERGAGIGFVEIAKRCDSIEHKFTKISDKKFYFTFKAVIKNA